MKTALIRVKVRTSARREIVEKLSDTSYNISVREKPEANRANMRVTELLAAQLGVATSRVRIIKGHHASSKIFSCAGD